MRWPVSQEFIKGSGLTKCVFKTDQESSIKALTEEALKEIEQKD